MLRSVIIAGILLLPLAAVADFDSGCKAFEQGDFDAARQHWQPLAEKGHAQAQFRLGCLYVFGQGVPQDSAMALRLYRLAAEQGDADAQNNLGGMYAEGLGVEPDLIRAYMWFEIAARSGHDVASRNRDFIAERMTSEQIADARAMAREWRPSRR